MLTNICLRVIIIKTDVREHVFEHALQEEIIMTLSDTILRRYLIKTAIIIITVIIIFGFVRTVKASVTEDSTRVFRCESILINDNDTLWDIARRYYTSEYDNINHYIAVIMKANNLTCTTIHSGNYLIIPYYN